MAPPGLHRSFTVGTPATPGPSNAGVFTDYYGSAKVESRWCPGYADIATLLHRFVLDLNNPRITPIVLNILKHPGNNPDCQGSPWSCHGRAKLRQGFVTMTLRFFTDAPGSMTRGDPAPEPGQWNLGLKDTHTSSQTIRSSYSSATTSSGRSCSSDAS